MPSAFSSRFIRGIVCLTVLSLVTAPAAAKPKPKPVAVTNFPATQAVQVQNFPTTQAVQVQNFPTASVAPLAPTKPSQLLTLTTVDGPGAPCGVDPIGLPVMLQQNSDGTTSAFSIPPGMVFVVTGLDWVQFNGSAETVFLHSTTPSGGIFPMVQSHDAGGGASIAVTGVTFTAGQTVCVSPNSGNYGTLSALVHGYLTTAQ